MAIDFKAVSQDIYATRPIKTHNGYIINLYRDGALHLQVPFSTRKVARVFMSRYDNWDKLCARVPERQPVQGELELVA
jgi:hypothetical protein